MLKTLPISMLLATLATAGAEARTICTVVMDADTQATILQEGDCKTRVTPASTFKLPLAVMGFDAEFLKNEHEPLLSTQKGDPDWGGAEWKKPTDPERWLKYSVVWYSQRITKALGQQKLEAYARSFGYGNADLSGDPGKNNGLDRSWISSSLKISPLEQVAFLQKFATARLPVSKAALDKTKASMEALDAADGWTVRGKTGMAYPRLADGSFDRNRPWGWYVGLAERDKRRIVFARLVQDDKKMADSPSFRARDALISELPGLAGR